MKGSSKSQKLQIVVASTCETIENLTARIFRSGAVGFCSERRWRPGRRRCEEVLRVMIPFIVILLLHFSCALQAMPPRDALSRSARKSTTTSTRRLRSCSPEAIAATQANDRTSGVTPLYVAQEYVVSEVRRLSVLRRLLRVGAWVDGRTADGSTTLMLAAYQGDTDAVSLLLEWAPTRGSGTTRARTRSAPQWRASTPRLPTACGARPPR